MNGLDLLISVSLVSAVVAGYRVGLLARVCSWVGLLLGLVVTTENMGAILRIVGDPSRGDEALAMAVALFGGCWLGKAIGMSVGLWLHRRLPMRPLRTADRAAGAALGGTGVVVVVWLVLPLLAFVPGWPAEQSRASAVSRFVHERLPAPPGSLASLRAFVSGGVFPPVLGTFDRSPETRSSPAQVVLDPDVSARVRRSVVQVESVACGRILDGTGFVAGERLVLTNGHVVAGSKRVTVIDDEGIRHPAMITAFRSRLLKASA